MKHNWLRLGCLGVLCLFPLFSAMAQSVDCKADRARFLAQNPSLRGYDDPQEFKKRSDQTTTSLRRLMAEVTVKKLNAGATADTITDYLGCITDGSGYIPVEKRGTGGDENRLTNAPVVYMPETASPPQAIAATYPVLGRATDYNWAIAPSRPLVQCFAKKDGQWSLIGEFGGEYESQFLSMYPLNSPVPGETWALLSGRHIGDTGGRLLLEVVACDGKTFTKKWSRDEIRWGKVDVSGSTVVLTYEKLDEKGRVVFSQEDPIRYTEVLHVTPKGLE